MEIIKGEGHAEMYRRRVAVRDCGMYYSAHYTVVSGV
jgi:hypothetical protein